MASVKRKNFSASSSIKKFSFCIRNGISHVFRFRIFFAIRGQFFLFTTAFLALSFFVLARWSLTGPQILKYERD